MLSDRQRMVPCCNSSNPSAATIPSNAPHRARALGTPAAHTIGAPSSPPAKSRSGSNTPSDQTGVSWTRASRPTTLNDIRESHEEVYQHDHLRVPKVILKQTGDMKARDTGQATDDQCLGQVIGRH